MKNNTYVNICSDNFLFLADKIEVTVDPSMKDDIFFTIGYEGLGIKRFLEILSENGVRTLVDSRHNPFSVNPDFRQKKLISHVEHHGIKYEHLREYGIPSEIRKAGNPMEWYVQDVKPKVQASRIESFDQPVCFMCMEKDVNSCHRKIILEALNEQGLKGKDLYPISGGKLAKT